MTINGNGRRKRVLEALPPFDPAAVGELFDEFKATLVRLATTEAERALLNEHLLNFEARPAVARLCDLLERRATDGDDRWILDRAHRFLRVLPEPLPEPAVDPKLERLILDQTTKRVAAEGALDAVQRQLSTRFVELSKQERENPKSDHSLLRAQVAGLRQDVTQARDAVDREMGRLAQLLAIRDNRRRAFLLAAATK